MPTLSSLYHSAINAVKRPRNDVGSLNQAISNWDVDKVERKLSRGVIPDASSLELTVGSNNLHHKIIRLVVAAAIEHKVEPTSQTLTNILTRLEARNPRLTQSMATLFSVTAIPPEPRALDDAVCTGNSDIVKTIGTLYTSENQPGPEALTRALTKRYLPNHELTKAVIDIFATTGTPPETRNLDDALLTGNVELVQKTGALYTPANQPEPRALSRALTSGNPELAKATLAVFTATKTPPETRNLDDALLTGDVELVQKTGALYTPANQPEPRALSHALTSGNPELARATIAIFAATHTPPPEGSLDTALRTGDRLTLAAIAPLCSEISPEEGKQILKYAIDTYLEGTSFTYPADERNVPQAAKAFVTWESLPQAHPFRQGHSLQDVMQSAETQQSFTKNVALFQKEFQEETAIPLTRLPAELNREIGSYLTHQDASNLAVTNKAHKKAAKEITDYRTALTTERAAAAATPSIHR